MVFFECYYLTAVPSQSACSADSSPKGRAKGCYRICPPSYNFPFQYRQTSDHFSGGKNGCKPRVYFL